MANREKEKQNEIKTNIYGFRGGGDFGGMGDDLG